ncbi:MAG: DNA ligase D, partial [Hyphomicrobiales bacterium]
MVAQGGQQTLAEYNRRRDFRRTPEPKGARGRKAGHSFVVQKHAARRLHYDFRLELDGVLKSWAVTKGPSLDPSDKRLAVRTEDHPLDYGGFEGVIPKGEYGGGTVMLWDRGTWEPDGDPHEGLKQGKLAFTLHGERMKGGWALIRMRSRRKGDRGRDNWLLIKERDAEASDHGDDLTGDARTSVASGRSMEQIARGSDIWRSGDPDGGGRGKARGKDARGRGAGKTARASRGRVRLPAFAPPQLATLVDSAPTGKGWLHEVKFDGYRAIASIGGGDAVIRTRNGLDWTDRFPAIAEALSKLEVDSALLDGEIAVADRKGRTDFDALQEAISNGGGGGMGYYLFDLLELDGKPLRSRRLAERKKRLAALLKGQPKAGPLFYSDHIEGRGETFFRQACDTELEGIICKRADAPYRSGRTKSWLKVKCGKGQEFVIIGWRPSARKGRPFSSLLLGLREGDALRYCGRVGSGFGDDDFDRVWPELKSRERKTPPADDVPAEVKRTARFVTPELVAEIAFRGWTRAGYVRQGSFKGLRRDKPASAIVRETPAKPSGRTVTVSKDETGAMEIEGVRVTHPDRVLWPSQGVTKRGLIDHYLSVADAMLPHLAGRPLSLVRCPAGRGGECFYQKHASPGFPDAFHSVTIREKSGTGEYLHIADRAGLVAAVQMGVLELHIWGARRDRLEKPDRLVFDLDPDEGLDFARVKAAASEMRRRLADLGLESFLLATGGKGLHVVAPLERRHGWEE